MRSGAIAILTALLAAAGALAAEAPTRAKYVDTLEEICKLRAQATQRAMRGARSDISAERLDIAAGKFARAERIFGATVRRIAAEPRPPVDGERLRKWFGYLNRQRDYLQEIVAALRADEAVRSQRLISRFIHNGNLANNVVLAFGFEHCSFKFSRYG